MPSPNTDLQDTLRRQLEARAVELRGEVAAVAEERKADNEQTGPHDVEDAGERGEQRTHDAIRQVEAERDAAELRDIATAFERMDAGSYGTCTDCGTDIPAARLQAQPTAARCVPCQEKYEASRPPGPRVPLP